MTDLRRESTLRRPLSNDEETKMKVVSSLLILAAMLSACVTEPPPSARATTVIVPPSNGTTTVVVPKEQGTVVLCRDGTRPPCYWPTHFRCSLRVFLCAGGAWKLPPATTGAQLLGLDARFACGPPLRLVQPTIFPSVRYQSIVRCEDRQCLCAFSMLR